MVGGAGSRQERPPLLRRHDWWNSSKTDDVHVLIEIEQVFGAQHIDPGRFELLIGTLFGLANDGRVDRKGRPHLLQAAVIAEEFRDVIVFSSPPLFVQRIALLWCDVSKWRC